MMIKSFRIVSLLVLASLVFVAGCSTGPVAGSEHTAGDSFHEKQSAQLILLPDDIPQDFFVIENRTKDEIDMSRLALDLGWRGGYIVRYQKNEGPSIPPTIISQNIAVYPAENLPEILHRGRSMAGSQDQYLIMDLPNPDIGDISTAIAAYENTKPEITMIDPVSSGLKVPYSAASNVQVAGQQPAYYEIAFTRGNIYEIFRMSGPSTDYEILLGLARTAFNKT
ncbi:MAG: hypothetical protein A4E35_01778 [Methanoregula sp. PtaU1.Bin051]|nr:MAG: hypothetical protein A4E35_01778 [Methanoregula sp. PtaU1.Bin051]